MIRWMKISLSKRCASAQSSNRGLSGILRGKKDSHLLSCDVPRGVEITEKNEVGNTTTGVWSTSAAFRHP